MTMTDPLADMFTRIMNGQAAGKSEVKIPFSNLKLAVNKVLKNEGYISDFNVDNVEGKSTIVVKLKYFNGTPVISKLERVSKPGRRVYKNKNNIPVVLGGLGISIISTSEGLLTDIAARKKDLGGEVLSNVS